VNQVSPEFWAGKRVFVTGHTGFKGSWICLWLQKMKAKVTGYALAPPTDPNLFSHSRVEEGLVHSIIADVRNGQKLQDAMVSANPEIVIHMAAQPLVRDSYQIPVETYAINVMGTVNLLEAVRHCPGVRAVVNVTSDKCYENREWFWGYREIEPMGGYDPYSNSKGCSELVTAGYRSSFFNPDDYERHGVAVASARAGNVIGGGDWARDRLLPDCVRALLAGKKIRIRNPNSIRPWQHVLEPLSGYLILAQKLYKEGPAFAEGWNFGPFEEDARTVGWIVKRFCTFWGNEADFEIDDGYHPHEANYLKLDWSKAKSLLGWSPRWHLEKALFTITEWCHALESGEDLRKVCFRQIEEFEECCKMC